jgi:hypothetical protein
MKGSGLNLKTFFPTVMLLFALTVMAKNPYLPMTAFIPDGEPRVFTHNGETRVYIYGSRDEKVTGYCGYGHDVWSAPIHDLTNWTNHGEIFHLRQLTDLGWDIADYDPISNTGGQNLAAPDCIYHPASGKYYLYTWLGAGPRRALVAGSDSPTGPFTDPVECKWPIVGGFSEWYDPAAFVDDDGRVYVYWGGGRVHRPYRAEVDPNDMHTIIGGYTYDTTGLANFFEAASMRKITLNGVSKYVLVYMPTDLRGALVYSYADQPLGPFTYGGIIVSNYGAPWGEYLNGGNNHGGIFEGANGQWYVAYHRQSNDDYSRQARMEPINLRIEDGKVLIDQVPVTSQGVEVNGLDAFRRYNAGIYCYREGDVVFAGNRRESDGLNPLTGIKDHTTIGYMYLNFGDRPVRNSDRLKLRLHILTNTDGYVEVLIADDPAVDPQSKNRRSIGRINFTANKQWHELEGLLSEIDSCPITLQGKRGVYLRFVGNGYDGELCQLKELEFASGDSPTPNPLQRIVLPAVKAGGKLAAVPSRAQAGESVKLVPEPTNGYGLNGKALKVTCSNGSPVTTRRNADGTYEFKMPDAPVDVHAVFVK